MKITLMPPKIIWLFNSFGEKFYKILFIILLYFFKYIF